MSALSEFLGWSGQQHPGKLLPLWHIDGDTLISTQGCYFKAFKIVGLDSEYTDGEMLVELAQKLYTGARKHLPVGTFMHFVTRGHRDYSDVWERFDNAPAPDDLVLAYQRKRRLEFMQNRRPHRQDLCLAVGTLEGLNHKEFSQLSEETHRRRMEKVQSLAMAVKSVLHCSVGLDRQRAGIALHPMSGDELLDVIFTGCNPDGSQLRSHRSGGLDGFKATLREQMMRSPISWSDHHVRIGNAYSRVYTLKSLPEQTRFAQMELFLNLPFDFRLSVNLAVPSQQFRSVEVDLTRNISNSLATRNQYSQPARDRKRLDAAVALDDALESTGQGFVQAGVQVAVLGASMRELRENSECFLGAMNKAGYEFYEESGAHDREYFKTIPGMAARFDRWRKVMSNNAVDLMPVFAARHGDSDPVLMLKTDRGELFSYNPAEPSSNNWNACIFGATGSGKSVIVNMLITSGMLANVSRGPVMVVDYAGKDKSSYLNLVRLFGGKFVPVLVGDGEAINPFYRKADIVDSHGECKREPTDFLLVFLDILLGNNGQDRDSQLDRTIMQTALLRLYAEWEGEEAPLLEDYMRSLEFVVEEAGPDKERGGVLVRLLRGFLSGPNARLFNRPTTLRVDCPLVVFDLYGIKSMPENMQGALSFLVCDYLRRVAFSSECPGIKYIILDELAALLKRAEMVELASELLTTARKHLTGVIMITQEYLAFCKSAINETCVANSRSSWFFSHGNAVRARERIVSDFGFNEREELLFQSLETIKGTRSEVLLRTSVFDAEESEKDIFTKLHVELSPFDYQLATSDHRDRTRQREVAAAHPDWDLVEVLQECAAERHSGSSHHA